MILVHMGIGKVNATWQTVWALERYKPDLVTNFCTEGAVMSEIRGLVEVGAACQRDMDVRALGFALGHTPFEADRDLSRFANSPLLCGTGDSFAASRPELPCDLVDMELYAVAKVCRSERTPLRTFKYISDQADHAAPQDWLLALNHAALAFSARVQQEI